MDAPISKLTIWASPGTGERERARRALPMATCHHHVDKIHQIAGGDHGGRWRSLVVSGVVRSCVRPRLGVKIQEERRTRTDLRRPRPDKMRRRSSGGTAGGQTGGQADGHLQHFLASLGAQ